ncbi:MAG: heme exporter protein CcmB [Alphaproteobacteria bacterium]
MSAKPYLVIIRRDMRLLMGRGPDAFAALAFFAVVACLFPFAAGNNAAVLRTIAPGVIWVAALLSALLSLDTAYARDYDDGTFDLLLLSPLSPSAIAAAKMAAHWLVSGLPLVLGSLVACLLFDLPLNVAGVLAVSLTLGTLYMSLLGGAGAALALGSRRSGLLLAVIVLPLFTPMLVFGVMAGSAGLAGLSVTPYLLLQLAMVVAALPLMPFAAASFLALHLRS